MISKTSQMMFVILVAVLMGLCTHIANAAKYEYDALNRLTRVVYDANTSIEYSYDGVGNRMRKLVIKPPNPDINLNGIVNLVDFAKLAENWMKKGDHKIGDLNCDGVVDLVDLEIMTDYWLQPG